MNKTDHYVDLSTDRSTEVSLTERDENMDLIIEELDKRSDIVFGENGSAEYTLEAMGDPRLGLFFKLVHNVPIQDLKSLIDRVFMLIKKTKNSTVLYDLFVLLFQTRDPRGGKGRRRLFYEMTLIIYNYFPQIVLNLLYLIPMYGYFKDYFNLLEMIHQHESQNVIHQYRVLTKKIYLIIANQIKLDTGEYENAKKESRKPIISLLAKFIPKEGKHFDKQLNFVENISNMMYPGIEDINDRKRAYRIQISLLNKLLDVTEIKMSANKFSEIVFSHITSKNALKYRKAFLNLNVNRSTQRSIEKDRIDARNNFIQSIRDKKIKGGTLEVYDIVKSIMQFIDVRKYSKWKQNELILSNENTNWEEELLKTQWEDMRQSLIKKIDKNTKGTFKINNMIPIVDVSGSMEGMPMLVAIGLGILISEMGTNIKDRILTFSENPKWIDLENLNPIEKIEKVVDSEWGMNTNFEKVYDMLIDVARTKRFSRSQIPDLIVFSDMQFDEATGRNDVWETHYAKIFNAFHQLGLEIEGKPYDPPMIVFWNLRGDTRGFPVMGNTQNVKMLSGFSPNLLQYVMNGDIDKNVNESTQKSMTPYETMRQILDDPRYDVIRQTVDAMIKKN